MIKLFVKRGQSGPLKPAIFVGNARTHDLICGEVYYIDQNCIIDDHSTKRAVVHMLTNSDGQPWQGEESQVVFFQISNNGVNYAES